jgi:DNA-binding HxlR family transcriptional regulator
MPSRSADRPPLEEALVRVGDRWTLLLVDALLGGPRRFNELQEALPGIAPNILTSRLRQLAHRGVLVARPYSRRPLRLDYELTESGHELAGALRLLAAWGAGWAGSDDGAATSAMRHHACGTPLEVRLWCPTCGRPADEHEPPSGLSGGSAQPGQAEAVVWL